MAYTILFEREINIMRRLLILLCGLCCFNYVQAFPCFVTIVKDNCWLNYNLNVDVTNADTGKSIMKIIVPQGQAWVRQPFVCQTAETLSLTATFDPVIWESQADKVYTGKHYWGLPKAILKGHAGWNVTVCFSKDFAEVPLPPDAPGKCECDLKSIPPIDPIKVN